ncbi:MAG: hypothetical protein R3Y05_01185 [bacterium]
MPFTSEKIVIANTKHDRRCKLSLEQKEEIKELYSTGRFSLNDLAKRFEVSKKTILLIVNPKSKEKNDNYIKENWKNFQAKKEDRTKAIRETRQHKQKLYIQGEIK